MQKEIMPINNSPLRDLEIQITRRLSRIVPSFIGTKTLTFFTLFSSVLIFFSYYLSRQESIFLFLASFFIIIQWIFDCLDGTIGRLRKEGLVRWGFYMDHFFDYFFMSAVILGLYFILPLTAPQMLFLFFIASSFMISFFLMHDANRDKESDFRISFLYFSPIEFRLVIIGLNISLYFIADYTKSLLIGSLPYINLLLSLTLIVMVYINQKKLSNKDVPKKSG